MEKTIAEKLTDIFSPAIDENACISLPKAEQLVQEAGFNICETGFDNLTEVLDELSGQFSVDYKEQPAVIKCLLADNKTAASETQKTLTCKQRNYIKYKMIKSLQSLATRYPLYKGCIPLNLLERQMMLHDASDMGDMSLTDFIKLYPQCFELTVSNDGPGVKLVSKNMTTAIVAQGNVEYKSSMAGINPGEQSTESPLSKETMKENPLAKRYISNYKLFDFAFFPNYRDALDKLVNMSEPDGWFVLTDPAEPDPYYLVDLMFRRNFALAAQRSINGQGGIRLSMMSAETETGFHTKEGLPIIAYFGINKRRDTENCQSWYFNGFRVEGQTEQASTDNN